jgi:hypothetical protein
MNVTAVQVQRSCSLEYVTSISYGKKAAQEAKERAQLHSLERAANRTNSFDVQLYKTNAKAIEQTYDAVIANTLSLLQRSTLNLRFSPISLAQASSTQPGLSPHGSSKSTSAEATQSAEAIQITGMRQRTQT